MIRPLLLFTVLLPFVSVAQPINTMNNPNQSGYENPSQQRMQTRMLSQQQQQQGVLNQQLQNQTRLQQRQLQTQLDSTLQRVQPSRPGKNDTPRPPVLPP